MLQQAAPDPVVDANVASTKDAPQPPLTQAESGASVPERHRLKPEAPLNASVHRHEQAAFRQELSSRVTSAQGCLTVNDIHVVEHLQTHLDELPFATADSVAAKVRVSRAAVVRLSRKLGYPGFAALRDASRSQFHAQPSSPLTRFWTTPAARDGLDVAAQEKFTADGNNLKATWELLAAGLGPAAKDVALARQVYVGGNRQSFGLALYFHRLLSGVRVRTHLLDPSFPDEIAQLTPDDLLVICLFRRYATASVHTLERAARLGAKTVAVTDGKSSPFLRGVTHVLATSTESPTLFQSMVAALATLEALAASVAGVAPDEASQLLAARERIAHEESFFYRASRQRGVTRAGAARA